MGGAASTAKASLDAAWAAVPAAQHAAALERVEAALAQREALSKPPVAGIVVTVSHASRLRDADNRSTSDPYVKAVLDGDEGGSQRTGTVRNEVRRPVWNAVLTVPAAAGTVPAKLAVEVWDNDGGKGRDDSLGVVEVEVGGSGTQRAATHRLTGRLARGTVTFKWRPEYAEAAAPRPLTGDVASVIAERIGALSTDALQAAAVRAVMTALVEFAPDEEGVPAGAARSAADDAPRVAAAPAPVPVGPARAAAIPKKKLAVRKEVRLMSAAEKTRFADALEQMMENTGGVPQTSPFFKLAGYHGWPEDYCAHRQEKFPAWHRAYLVEFEKQLQIADKAIGGDGNIGLPYWDWQVSGRRHGDAHPPLTLPLSASTSRTRCLPSSGSGSRSSPSTFSATSPAPASRAPGLPILCSPKSRPTGDSCRACGARASTGRSSGRCPRSVTTRRPRRGGAAARTSSLRITPCTSPSVRGRHFAPAR